ncbi:MAG: 2-haloalkanoic acid dehalogenase, partial [Parcubacteria group bacterium GW2011_GWA2_47_8]
MNTASVSVNNPYGRAYYQSNFFRLGVKIKASGLERYFSLILVDSDHKDALYDKALKKLKVQASEIVVVDDRVVRGIAWGNRVGATTIWVKRGKFADELPTKATGYPTYTISDIEACAKIIDSIDQKQTGIQVPQGIYKHFKGGMYRVIGT